MVDMSTWMGGEAVRIVAAVVNRVYDVNGWVDSYKPPGFRL
jgi:hypothetical protein